MKMLICGLFCLIFCHFIQAEVVGQKAKYVVLITGCSSGIGQSAALEISKSPNFKVWATMRDTSKSVLPTDRENLKVAELDVTNEDSVNETIQRITDEDGTIDIVINNAGFGLAGALEVVELEEAMKLFDVNVWGVVRVLHAVLPFMRRQRWGYVINISSTSGIRGIPCMEYYTASKFALEGLTDSMRYSLSPYNISVTNLNAGPVRTSFTNRFGAADVGGRGTRKPRFGRYLQSLTDRMIAGLNYRMQSAEGQTSDDIGVLLHNLALLRVRAKRLTDVPFNLGSGKDSQKLLEEIRVQPTGWGGVYSEILKSLPPLPPMEVELAEEQGHNEL